MVGEEYPLLKERELVIVSNRGPVSHYLAANGSVSARRSTGGLASAFLALARHLPFIWVAAAVTPGDRVVARKNPHIVTQLSPSSQPMAVHLVQVPKAIFHRSYDVIANRLLWPIHHYLWDPGRVPDIMASLHTAWFQGYVPVNQAFARAVIGVAEKAHTQPVVLLQDYHLFLVAALLRPQLPNAIISHFLHIPWPGPRYWMMLPDLMKKAILKSLASCNVVGLQTKQDVRNLLDSWELSDKEAVVDRVRGVVITPEERLVAVRAYPISVDVAHLQEVAESPQVHLYREGLRRSGEEKVIVRVDRLDPIKNVVRGFLAYERLLEEHPELQQKVRFHALLVPSRQEMTAYLHYRKRMEKVVERVNLRFGVGEWQPITTYVEENYERAVGLLQDYDVLVVNSLMDGMNLVAKEGCVLNRNNGVVVLSVTAGCYQELAEGVLPVGPTDIASLKESLYQALTMSDEERAKRASMLREVVRQRDISRWLASQLQDLQALA